MAIPIRDGKINMKVTDIYIKNKKNQLVYVDLSIPSEIEAGVYEGKISIFKKGKIIESIQIKLNLVDIVMPATLSFVPELNMYRGPEKAGTERFFHAHRLAHDHRCVINRVPYGQNGSIHKDMIPVIAFAEDGGVEIDWSDYDRRLGPLFDGTAFATGERKGIPVEKFYLPFFENWPSVLASNYQYEYVQKKTREIISEHAMEAPNLEEALTTEYKKIYVQVLQAFVSHFEEKRWDQTEIQFYLNNTWYRKNSSSWWRLDEPMSYDDWMALEFFGNLFQMAKGPTSLNFVYRADISNPRWQHDWLDGILERMYVQNKSFFMYPERVRQMKKEGQIDFSVYGALNDIEFSNNQTVLWCMRAFIEGADGVLPWQSLGGAKALSVPDKNALIIDARKALGIDWIVSLRVKALRRGQQNVELLAMLEQICGYNREQIRDFFYSFFGLDKNMERENEIGHKLSKIFSDISNSKIDCFRRTLINMLLTS